MIRNTHNTASLDPFRFILVALSGWMNIRRAAAEFTAHYHVERNHRGIENRLICPDPSRVRKGGAVKRRERLGGLLNYYYRTAA